MESVSPQQREQRAQMMMRTDPVAPSKFGHRIQMVPQRQGDLQRLRRGSILASFMLVTLGGALVLRVGDSAPPSPQRPQNTAQFGEFGGTADIVGAFSARRVEAKLPPVENNPSLETSAQRWADNLEPRGVGHDPNMLDGIDDNWQQVSELVSAGPSLEAAATALFQKPAGKSVLDDPTVNGVGVGWAAKGPTTYLVVRLIRSAPTATPAEEPSPSTTVAPPPAPADVPTSTVPVLTADTAPSESSVGIQTGF
jgi:hypothetical protein